MAFNSVIFLFLFLPVFLGLYFISGKKLQNIILIVFSILFYTWGAKILILLFLASVVMNYLGAKIIREINAIFGLIGMLLFNIVLLGFFKYYNFGVDSVNDFLSLLNIKGSGFQSIPNLVLPLGISFYTFRTISYIVDVYKKKIDPSDNFLDFVTWISMFPLISAGPIVRYSDMQSQLKAKNISGSRFVEGIGRFITGLAKKVLIAGTFSSVASYVFAAPISDISTLTAWVGIIAFTLELYFDFSGYSDMAIGIGKMIGFDFTENFNYPFISRNIREFWRRWHISLSSWLRDYLFLPISFSLSRKLKNETYFKIRTDRILYFVATLITFLVCGLWHGAAWTFIFWGLYFSIFLILEQFFLGRFLKRLWIPLQHFYTLLIVTCSFVIFKADSMADAFQYFGRMFFFTSGDLAVNSYISFFTINRETLVVAFFAILFATPVVNSSLSLVKKITDSRKVLANVIKCLVVMALAVLFFMSISYMASNTYNPFIYARF
jgi:alginate O-acetyltransferase complex protein AlgI